jgi:hypothetical protein
MGKEIHRNDHPYGHDHIEFALTLGLDALLLILEHHAASIDPPEPVATTWEMAFQKLQEKTPVAVVLLNLFAFLAPDAIPKRLLTDGQQYLPEALAVAVADRPTFDGVLAALRGYA